MKILVISDVHGNVECLEKILDIYNNENVNRLIVLGDFAGYFHSSKDYEIAEMLNNVAGNIIAVKGNCDSTEIESLLRFSLGYVKNVKINDLTITITHGHIYNRYNLPEECGKLFLFGHTHCGIIEKQGDKIIANPGSISKPRGGSQKSYILINDNTISLKSLEGNTIKKCIF